MAEAIATTYRAMTGEAPPPGLLQEWCARLRAGQPLSTFRSFVLNTPAYGRRLAGAFERARIALLGGPVEPPAQLMLAHDVDDAAMERALRATPEFRRQAERMVSDARRAFGEAVSDACADAIVEGSMHPSALCSGASLLAGRSVADSAALLRTLADPAAAAQLYDAFHGVALRKDLDVALRDFRKAAGRDLTARELLRVWPRLRVAPDAAAVLAEYYAAFCERWNAASEQHRAYLGSPLPWSDFLARMDSSSTEEIVTLLLESEEYARVAESLARALAPAVTGKAVTAADSAHIVRLCREQRAQLHDPRDVQRIITHFYAAKNHAGEERQ